MNKIKLSHHKRIVHKDNFSPRFLSILSLESIIGTLYQTFVIIVENAKFMVARIIPHQINTKCVADILACVGDKRANDVNKFIDTVIIAIEQAAKKL